MGSRRWPVGSCPQWALVLVRSRPGGKLSGWELSGGELSSRHGRDFSCPDAMVLKNCSSGFVFTNLFYLGPVLMTCYENAID